MLLELQRTLPKSALAFLCAMAAISCADDGSPISTIDPHREDAGADGRDFPDAPDAPGEGRTDVSFDVATEGDASDSGTHVVDSSDEADAFADAPRVSTYCGDRIRDPRLEECDDGEDGADDSCTADCRVRVVPLPGEDKRDAGRPDAGEAAVMRQVGSGAHVASASNAGFAVAYGEFVPPSPLGAVLLQAFDDVGRRMGSPIDVGVGQKPTIWAKPVVAALPGGRYAVAWTDDEAGVPGVRLRVVDALRATVGPARLATGAPAQDPDILWTGSELVVAWTDLVDAKYRSFDADLVALGAERSLASMSSLQSGVTLAPFGQAWAAAFYANEEGFSALEVVAGDSTWSTPPALPPPDDAKPALVALDDTHLLLVFAVGTESTDGGSSNASALRAAVLSTSSPGPVNTFAFGASPEGSAAATISTSGKPSATRVGDIVYVSWESSSNIDDPNGRTGFVATVELDPLDPTNVSWRVVSPPSGAARAGQHLAAAPLLSRGALISLWEILPDRLLLEFRPSPFVSLPAD